MGNYFCIRSSYEEIEPVPKKEYTTFKKLSKRSRRRLEEPIMFFYDPTDDVYVPIVDHDNIKEIPAANWELRY